MTVATFLAASAATFGISSASAQPASAYKYCLLTGPHQECSFTSFQQCQASRLGNTDFCELNSEYAPADHYSRRPQ
jgi:hypothetical protein